MGIIKKAFLKRAKEVHPDAIPKTADYKQNVEKRRLATKEFIEVKESFTSLISSLKTPSSKSEKEMILNQFDNWFAKEAGADPSANFHPIAFVSNSIQIYLSRVLRFSRNFNLSSLTSLFPSSFKT